ncbi:MAG: DUF499 domain-containing protein [Chloroflexi bacterium]|nr:DUF499 domain-containing protein [Chloroflexota bacterium]
MTAFHTIAIPHDDILAGRLTMDVFAADLWEVAQDRGPAEYHDPAQFFQKTYETEGLKALLEVVRRRLAGQGGDPVLQIQTPFGGGKTHALIAMYHRAAEWGARRVVLVGTAMGPGDTLWGTLEEQLTGEQQEFGGLVSPGRGEALRNLLAGQGPLLILMDEVLEYITKAAGVRVGDSTLAAQSIAFMHELTELVSTLERVSLVVTLPASLLERYDEQAERLFAQLQRVSGRLEKIYTPVQEDEISHVIRRRLFTSIDEPAAFRVVDEFLAYATRESLLPPGSEPSEYRRRFAAAFPFLPEAVDVLYERWGSLTSFQRTRGVLRLLALVIHALRDRNVPYLSLADFDLADQEIRRELLKHAGPEYDSVIAADITGPDAGARRANLALGPAYQGLGLGSRVATTIFMYSFSGGIERGAALGEIKRSATTLDNPSSAAAEAVEQLKEQLFYVQQQSGRYFFSTQPNLNRILLTRMENVTPKAIEEAERELLKRAIGRSPLKVYIWPERDDGILDTPDMKLLVLRAADGAAMRAFLERKGGTPRVNRNTLFFLAPLGGEHTALATLLRKRLAYDTLSKEALPTLSSAQRKEIADGLKKADGDLGEALRRAYRQLFLPSRDGVKEGDLGVPTYGESKGLDQEVYDKLRLDGEILERVAPRVIKELYLRNRDWVSTEQLYQAGLRTPGERRARGPEAWETGIAEGVRGSIFGLGELVDGQPRCLYFGEEPSISLSSGEILIDAEVCAAQRAAAKTKESIYVPAPTGQGEATNVRETGSMSPPDGSGGSASGGMGTLPAVRRSLTLTFTVPRGKVSGLMGVMNLLQQRFNRMEITIAVADGQMSEQDYEDKIREAFRQIGILVEESE